MTHTNQRKAWEMSKAGLLNYWYYKYEEFPFEKGKMIIRGSNGSGKSVTTQSFLPLLLDGNKQPQRLDPFSSRSRKIKDYIFGENPEVAEKTSYLFLEYKMSDENKYITTGMGLKATQSKDEVDAWYFIIKDKRIGQDINLFNYQLDEKGEKVMVPLSQKEFTNMVERERCGTVVTKQGDYADLVNNNIFRFDTIEEFKEMVDLVVRIRTPKLSNDLGPQVIYEILQRSLPELSYTDLRSLSETIQNIDEIKDKLKNNKDDLELIKVLSGRYDLYNKALLSKKAYDFMEAHKKKSRAHTDLEKAERDLNKAKKKEQDIQNRITSLENEQTKLEKKLENLKDNDVFKMKRNLIKLQAELKDQEVNLNKQSEDLEEKQSRFRDLGNEIKAKEDELSEIKRTIHRSIEDLDTISLEVEYKNHQLNRDSFLLSFNKQDLDSLSVEQWETNAESNKKEIQTIVTLLGKEENLSKQLEERREDYAKNESERDDYRKELEEKETALEDSLDQLKRDVLCWSEKNQELMLNEDEKKQIVLTINDLFEGTTQNDVDKELSEFYSVRYKKIVEEKAGVNFQIEDVKSDIQEKLNEIRVVESKKDPEPETRRSETVAVRKKLASENVLFVPFYEAVEFMEDVSDFERERIESALIEMGILDSLIVRPEDLHMVDDSDSVLVPHEIVEDSVSLQAIMNICLPTGLEELEKEVKKVLQSISTVENEVGTFVTRFGKYQHGLVYGIAVQNETSKFIGKEARRQHREKLLARLEEELKRLEDERHELISKKDLLEKRSNTLEQEKANFPSLDNVKQIQADINNIQNNITLIEKDLDRINKGIDNLSKDYNKVRKDRMELTSSRTIKPEVEEYERVLREAEGYMLELAELRHHVVNYNHKTETKNIKEVQFEEVMNDVEDLRGYVYEVEKGVLQKKSAISALEEAIEASGADDLEKEIEEAEKRNQEIPRELKEFIETSGGLKEKIPTLANDVIRHEKAIGFYKSILAAREELFSNELNRRFVEEFDKDTLSNEENIYVLAQIIVEDDKELLRNEVTTYHESLMSKFSEVRLKGLETYSPSQSVYIHELKEISDEGFELFAKELDELFNSSKRTILTLNSEGRTVSPKKLVQIIQEQVNNVEISLTNEDEKLFKEIIMDNIGERIRELIAKANEWKDDINNLMSDRNASSGLKLSLEWKPRKANDGDGELGTSELVDLLQTDPEELRPTDYRKLSKHFNSKINYAKEVFESDDKNKEKSFDYVIKDILDYRKWFEFKIYYVLGEESKRKELTKNRYNSLSGGERAMSMYIPLLSALYSKYTSASPEAPKIVSMDEAFAGVDEDNIRDMFELIEELDLNYILNSQSLWGDYDTVSTLSIAEIIRPKNAKDVTVVHYKWDGEKRTTRHQLEKDESEDEIVLTTEQQSLFI